MQSLLVTGLLLALACHAPDADALLDAAFAAYAPGRAAMITIEEWLPDALDPSMLVRSSTTTLAVDSVPQHASALRISAAGEELLVQEGRSVALVIERGQRQLHFDGLEDGAALALAADPLRSCAGPLVLPLDIVFGRLRRAGLTASVAAPAQGDPAETRHLLVRMPSGETHHVWIDAAGGEIRRIECPLPDRPMPGLTARARYEINEDRDARTMRVEFRHVPPPGPDSCLMDFQTYRSGAPEALGQSIDVAVAWGALSDKLAPVQASDPGPRAQLDRSKPRSVFWRDVQLGVGSRVLLGRSATNMPIETVNGRQVSTYLNQFGSIVDGALTAHAELGPIAMMQLRQNPDYLAGPDDFVYSLSGSATVEISPGPAFSWSVDERRISLPPGSSLVRRGTRWQVALPPLAFAPPADARAAARDARSLLTIGKPEQALRLLTQPTPAAGQPKDALLCLAVAHEALGDAASALAAVKTGLQGAEPTVADRRLLARLASATGDQETAEKAMAPVLASDKVVWADHRFLAHVRIYAGQLDRAAESLAAAKRDAPADQQPRLALDSAWLSYYQGRSAEAATAVAQAQADGAPPSECRYLMAATALLDARDEDAYTHLVAALKLDPGASGYGQTMLALVRDASKQPKAAACNSMALALLAEAAGQKAEAVAGWRSYAQRGASTKLRQLANQRVRALGG